MATPDGPLRSLDFIYTPSRDVARDVDYNSRVLGAEVVFAIEGIGTRVAMVRISDAGPAILFADHVDGDVPILVFSVDSLPDAMTELERRGWEGGSRPRASARSGLLIHHAGWPPSGDLRTVAQLRG